MKLLLTGAFQYEEHQIEEISHLGYQIRFVQDESLALDFDVSHIDAVVCNNLFLINNIREFKNLKFIQLTSAGYDRVPLKYINQTGIKLFNAGGVYSIPMAEWTVLKILELYKKSRTFYNNQEQHKWAKQRDLLELSGKTAAIVGFGNVGAEIAKRLKAFGVHIIAVNRREVLSQYMDEYIPLIDIDSALKKSDIIILALPLTGETKHIINKDRMDRLKNQPILINVARGGLIDETALIHALIDGKVSGAALDVFEDEPLRDSSLWDFGNVIVTPHNSFVSEKVNERLFQLIKENLRNNN